MNIKLIPGILLLLSAFTVPVRAHHSAAQYDFQKPDTIEGVVVEAKFANPHLKLVLKVADDQGTRDITYEGHSRNNLYRRGWRPDLVKVGDKITITIATPREGGDGGYVLSIRTAGGKEF